MSSLDWDLKPEGGCVIEHSVIQISSCYDLQQILTARLALKLSLIKWEIEADKQWEQYVKIKPSENESCDT